MYRRLTVRPGAAANPGREPPLAEPDMVIQATDYSYTLSTDRLESGWRTIRFHNAGAVEHIAEVALLKPGKTAAKLLEWVRNGLDPADSPKTTIGGSTRLATGRSSDIHIYVRPGRYVVFCMLHIPRGPQHVLVGMVKKFVVE
jgi:plastocyanin